MLAEFTNPTVKYGNFQRITLKILEKIPLQNTKQTYTYDSYNFNYEVSDEIVFLCMTDGSFSKAQSFRFIQQVKDE